jgi:hypothetical protein
MCTVAKFQTLVWHGRAEFPFVSFSLLLSLLQILGLEGLKEITKTPSRSDKCSSVRTLDLSNMKQLCQSLTSRFGDINSVLHLSAVQKPLFSFWSILKRRYQKTKSWQKYPNIRCAKLEGLKQPCGLYFAVVLWWELNERRLLGTECVHTKHEKIRNVRKRKRSVHAKTTKIERKHKNRIKTKRKSDGQGRRN